MSVVVAEIGLHLFETRALVYQTLRHSGIPSANGTQYCSRTFLGSESMYAIEKTLQLLVTNISKNKSKCLTKRCMKPYLNVNYMYPGGSPMSHPV